MISDGWPKDANGNVIIAAVNPTGLTSWVHYIPVTNVTQSAEYARHRGAGLISVTTIADTTGKTAWTDYVPVASVAEFGDSWILDDEGFLPISVAPAPVNQAPVVSITSPADQAVVTEGDTVTLQGSASDAEDGDLSAAIVWTSDVDGTLGTGANVATTLSAGPHTITASATDSGGLQDSDAVSVTVEAAGPVVLVQDSFTDADGTEIGAHTPEVGGPWFAQNWLDGSALAANEAEIQGGQLHIVPTGARGAFIDRGNTNDFTLEFDWHIGAAAGSVSVMMRYVVPHTGIKSATYFVIRQSSNDVILRHVVNGDTTNVASAPLTLANSAVHHVKATMVGNEFTLLVDGNLVLQATSTAHAAETHSGLMVPMTADETQVFDNFVITVADAASGNGTQPNPPASFGVTQADPGYLPVVPGARGFGMETPAGSGRHLATPATTVLFIDRLDPGIAGAGNSGSLAWCLTRPFPRYIVSNVSGLINMPADSVIRVIDPFFTVNLHTAPSPGLYVYGVTLRVGTTDGLLLGCSLWNGKGTTQGTGNALVFGAPQNNGGVNPRTRLIAANCDFGLGFDQNYSTFSTNSEPKIKIGDIAFWQCASLNGMVGASGYGNLYDCGNNDGVTANISTYRTYFSDNKRRNPRMAGAGRFDVSNCLGYNNSWNIELTTRESEGEISIYNVRHNGFVRGPDVGGHFENRIWTEDFGGGWITATHMHVADNVQHSAYDGAVFANTAGEPNQPTPHPDAIAPGYVPRPIVDSDAGLLEFMQLMRTHCGARPKDRLPFIQTQFDQCVNRLNGAGGFGRQFLNAADAGWPIAVAQNTINHTDALAHGGDPIPTAGQDDVMPSGYTRLEEWGLRRHAEFMPAGWDL